MSRYRFVEDEVVRLSLSDGDWIDVKKVLNAGEYRKLVYAQFKDTAEGDKVILDHAQVGIAKLLAYLLGWSFVDRDQRPEPYSLDLPEATRRNLIDNLDQATYRELLAAINAHEERQELELTAKKNAPATVKAS